VALVSELETKLTVNSAQFTAGIVKAQLAVTGLIAIGKKVVEALDFSAAITKIDDLNDTAQKLGQTFENTQRLAYAAKLAGTSIDSVGTGMRKLTTILDDASNGGEAAQKTLGRLGLAAKDLIGLSMPEQFQLISERIKQVPGYTAQAAIALELFGRSGLENMQLLRSNIGETLQGFDDLGLGITNSQAKAVAAFDDTRDAWGVFTSAFKDQLAANLAPTFTYLTQQLMGTGKNMLDLKSIGAGVASTLIQGFSGFLQVLDYIEQSMFKAINAAINGLNTLQAIRNGITEGLNSSVFTKEISGSQIKKGGYMEEIDPGIAGSRYEETRKKLDQLVTNLDNQVKNKNTKAIGIPDIGVINVAQELKKLQDFKPMPAKDSTAKIQVEASKDFIIKVIENENMNVKIRNQTQDLIAAEARGVAR
jgi:hypothetical protein